MVSAIEEAQVTRFRAGLDALLQPVARLGVAVSGGPDSLALLLLATAARPGCVEAATVDHGLRPDSRSEAEMVARLCVRHGISHRTLTVEAEPPATNLQAWAREARYRLLLDWAAERRLDAVATAHHVDDQAETLLMRLARGSGVGGLAGASRQRLLGKGDAGDILLIRPLLDWRRAELLSIVERAELEPVNDPSNLDGRFDRSRARALLKDTDWLDPQRLAAVAGHCRDADDALEWVSAREFRRRSSSDGAELTLDPSGLPHELRRRLLVDAIEQMTKQTPPGPKVAAALATLEEGGTTTLAGLKLEGGSTWRLSRAPPRTR